MYLAVDIGNSQISFGLLEGSELRHHWRKQTNRALTPDEFAAFLLPLLHAHSISISGLNGVALCSVVPSLDGSFREFSVAYLKQVPRVVSARGKLNFSLNVRTPDEVGADRLANAAYAVEKMRLPAIVIDFGTAITFDVVSSDKTYEGGAIVPGIRLAFEALGTGTAKLPMVGLEFPPNVIGKNTVECIQGGILYGYCDLLSGLLARTRKELGQDASTVLTGGYSDLFIERLGIACLPNLTLEGIQILASLQS